MAAQFKQIGNAVPVNLGYHVGRCVLAALGEIPLEDTMEVVAPLSLMPGKTNNRSEQGVLL